MFDIASSIMCVLYCVYDDVINERREMFTHTHARTHARKVLQKQHLATTKLRIWYINLHYIGTLASPTLPKKNLL